MHARRKYRIFVGARSSSQRGLFQYTLRVYSRKAGAVTAESLQLLGDEYFQAQTFTLCKYLGPRVKPKLQYRTVERGFSFRHFSEVSGRPQQRRQRRKSAHTDERMALLAGATHQGMAGFEDYVFVDAKEDLSQLWELRPEAFMPQVSNLSDSGAVSADVLVAMGAGDNSGREGKGEEEAKGAEGEGDAQGDSPKNVLPPDLVVSVIVQRDTPKGHALHVGAQLPASNPQVECVVRLYDLVTRGESKEEQLFVTPGHVIVRQRTVLSVSLGFVSVSACSL